MIPIPNRSPTISGDGLFPAESTTVRDTAVNDQRGDGVTTWSVGKSSLRDHDAGTVVQLLQYRAKVDVVGLSFFEIMFKLETFVRGI